jgi:protein arginine kinase
MEESKNQHIAWIEDATNEDYIVVSSRVRIARNIAEHPFPSKMNVDEGKEIRDLVNNEFKNDKKMRIYYPESISAVEQENLVEKHMISPQFINDNNLVKGLLINEKGSLSIMVNEEDHLRIQSILPGLNLLKCYDEVSAVDSYLEKKFNYAYDTQFGYLTSCPTNIGTGIRASVMLHLPGLVKTRNISKSLNAIAKLGLVARGIYGEGSEAMGNMFQISNQITLGRSEEEIIQNLNNIVNRLVDQERNAREYLYKEFMVNFEDNVGRALGVLKNCRKIDSNEAMQLLSEVRVGSEMNVVVNLDAAMLNKLIHDIQPAALQIEMDSDLSSSERDIARANILRKRLKGVE